MAQNPARLTELCTLPDARLQSSKHELTCGPRRFCRATPGTELRGGLRRLADEPMGVGRGRAHITTTTWVGSVGAAQPHGTARIGVWDPGHSANLCLSLWLSCPASHIASRAQGHGQRARARASSRSHGDSPRGTGPNRLHWHFHRYAHGRSKIPVKMPGNGSFFRVTGPRDMHREDENMCYSWDQKMTCSLWSAVNVRLPLVSK